jgi:murein DD-endopeptidase MepM/ murein hydrolase activator NlpD
MIFPTLKGQPHAEVNLNDLAKKWLAENYPAAPASNPLIDPKVCQQMVDEFHAARGLAFSYGGYLEDRSTVWADSYLTPKNAFLHLAVDFNAPIGTEVAVDQAAEVVFTADDSPLIGGWGSHVMFKLQDNPMYMLYAHLDSKITCSRGDKLAAGSVFATVGAPAVNGHWYSHVHVQALTSETFARYEHDIDALDGYASIAQKDSLRAQFPDPLAYVALM